MLRTLRESAGSWIIKILMGIMVAAFVLVGTGSYKAYRSSKVATVNGKAITVDEYQKAYNAALENIRRQFGNQLNDEMLKMMNIPQQALDQLIEAKLMSQAADNNNIRVSDKELAEAITKIPVFQDNGKFDSKRYKILLGQNRMTTESFEYMQKEAMLFEKLKTMVTSCVKVSDDEAKQWYNWDNASVVIDYAVFVPDSIKNIETSDAMLEEYYNSHKEDYKTEPTRKARYVRFDPASYSSKVNISNEEVGQYYNDHEDEFATEETASGRQIVLKVPEKAKPEDVEKRKQDALQIIEKAKAGEDFAQLAKTYSEGPEKESGGAIGPFTRQSKTISQPIADKAFSMETGEISDPIRTRDGWHILKVEAKNPSVTLPLDQVSNKIWSKLTTEREKTMAYDDALALYNSSLSGEDLVKNATSRKLNLTTTAFFTQAKGPGVDMIHSSAEFAKIAFKLPVMEISDVSEIDNSYYLIQVIEEQPEKIPDLDAVKEEVRLDVLDEQKEKAAEDAAKQFIKQIREKGSISSAAKEAGIEIKTATLLNRNSKPSEDLAKDASVVEAAFDLTGKNTVTENPVKTQKGYYVIALRERNEPAAEGFAQAKGSIIQRLTGQKQADLFKTWTADLRKNSKVVISDKMLKQAGS